MSETTYSLDEIHDGLLHQVSLRERIGTTQEDKREATDLTAFPFDLNLGNT